MRFCHGGGYAEYVAVDEGHCMPLPKGYSMAAHVYQKLYNSLEQFIYERKLQKNEKVLIHGGASGIGTTAIQLAKHFGAKVYATAEVTKNVKL